MTSIFAPSQQAAIPRTCIVEALPQETSRRELSQSVGQVAQRHLGNGSQDALYRLLADRERAQAETVDRLERELDEGADYFQAQGLAAAKLLEGRGA
jgi:hypothetical protein